MGAVRTTVVIPSYRSWATLPRVLAALRPQVEGRPREAILVDSSGDRRAEDLRRAEPWLTVVALPERALPGRARNLAVETARGQLVAFLDADAVPEPSWLGELEAGLHDGVDAVAGAILNGTPRSMTGTAGYLLEFADWLPTRTGPFLHAATCNLLVRRETLLDAGGFPSELWPGEDTVLTFELASRGRLGFAPAARVSHLNRTGLSEFVSHQVRLGRGFREVCRRVEFPARGLSRPLLSPLLAVVRLLSLGRKLSRSPREAAAALVLLPLLVLGAGAWAAGVATARG